MKLRRTDIWESFRSQIHVTALQHYLKYLRYYIIIWLSLLNHRHAPRRAQSRDQLGFSCTFAYSSYAYCASSRFSIRHLSPAIIPSTFHLFSGTLYFNAASALSLAFCPLSRPVHCLALWPLTLLLLSAKTIHPLPYVMN